MAESLGQEVSAPEVVEDASFDAQLALYEAQQSYITDSTRFATGVDGGQPFNGRDLIVELLTRSMVRLLNLEEANALSISLGIADSLLRN